MTYESYSYDKTLYIKFEGDIDHHYAGEVRENIDKLILDNRPQKAVFDLSQVRFMDSSGLGLILGRYRKLQSFGGKLVLQNPTNRIQLILKMAGVDKLIPYLFGEIPLSPVERK